MSQSVEWPSLQNVARRRFWLASCLLALAAGCSCRPAPPPPPDVMKIGMKLVDHSVPVEERREAARLLGEHGINDLAAESFMPLMIAIQDDPDLQVRLLAVQSLRWVTTSVGSSSVHLIPELKRLRDAERHSAVRRLLQQTIDSLGGEGAAPQEAPK